MGHPAIPCAVHAPHVDALHDSLRGALQASLHAQNCRELPDIGVQQAVEDSADVFGWSQSHAFGHDREALIEAFRALLADASDKHIGATMLSDLVLCIVILAGIAQIGDWILHLDGGWKDLGYLTPLQMAQSLRNGLSTKAIFQTALV